MISFLSNKKITIDAETQTKYADIMDERNTTKRIEESIDESACIERFQEFTEKRNEGIYKKIKFNIRNYVILTNKEINEIRLLDDNQKMEIVILMNTAIKYLLKLV